ncbi:CBN-NMUR-3 protein, partial [Aphelenchoides avenae]
VMLLLTFVVPIAFILYCYAKILATLNEMSVAENSAPAHVLLTQRHSSDTSDLMKNGHLSAHSRASGSILKSQKAHRTVLKMLVTVTVVFFLCYLPYHIERLIVQYTRSECSKSTTCVLLYPITGLLQYVSATLNPIIYNLMSPRFRTAFRSIIRQLAEDRTLSRDRFTAMPMSIKA